MTSRPRLLFFSEAVTLAHVSRPLALAEYLDPSKYDVHFASAYRYESFIDFSRFTYWPMESLGYDAFISSASGDKSAYDDELIEGYIAEEQALFREVRPDLIINDARWTLAVSAPACKIPMVNINNAYWSPYQEKKQHPVPAYKRSSLYRSFPPALADRLMPYGLIKRVFPVMNPYYQRKFLAPFNRARARRGLPAIRDFHTLHTYGDWTLYCDVPELSPTLIHLPPTQRFVGPLLWSPPTARALPAMDADRPVVFVSLGSSNDVPRSTDIILELTKLDVQVLVATAGRFELPAAANLFVEEYLPGVEACRRAAVVLCTGGSTAAHQALSVGAPVLGLPSNADQHLCMQSIVRAGAGLSLRADQTHPQEVRAALERMLADPQYRARATELATVFQQQDARVGFQKFLDDVLPSLHPSQATQDGWTQTLLDPLRRRANESPDLPAFWALNDRKQGRSALTYGEVWRRAGALAGALKARGLRAGDHVAFVAPPVPGWELMHLAVLWAGGVVVGLDAHDAPERFKAAVDRAAPRGWVLLDQRFRTERPSLFDQQPLFVVALTTSDDPSIETLDSWLAENHLPPPPPDPDGGATLLFTSGTTGEPKGIRYNHRQLLHAVRAIGRAYRQLPVGFESVCWLPLSNLFQRMVNLCAIDRGACITFVPHPAELIDALPVIRPDVIIGVPRFYEKWESGVRKSMAAKPRTVRLAWRAALAVSQRHQEWVGRSHPAAVLSWLPFRILDAAVLSRVCQVWGGRLRYLISGAAPLSRKTAEFFRALGMLPLEAYGTSENTIPLAMNRPGRHRLGTVGPVLGPNELSLSATREVLVKGPGLFQGYWPDISGGVDAQGYYHTGDEGRWEGGFLQLMGRTSEIIKTSTGRRLAPTPIETHFKELPFVDQAVVLGNGRKGPLLIVTIDPAGKDSAPAPDLSEDMGSALRTHAAKLPRLSRPLGALVLSRAFSVLSGEATANLKLRRHVIEQRYQSLLDELELAAATTTDDAPLVWFLTSADVRAQNLRTLPTLEQLRTSAFSRGLALAFLASRTLRAYLQYVLALHREPWEYSRLKTRLLEESAADLARTLGPLKGPLVKVGQTLSYADLRVNPAVRSALAGLQMNSPPLAGDVIRKIVRSSLGREVHELFDDWHDVPLAAASVSQIHLARLKDGTRVVVKVLYPGIDQIVRSDLRALGILIPVISAISGIDNIRENFAELRQLLLAECDLRREAYFADRFRSIFRDHPSIAIPRVYPELSSHQVLTMDHIEGQTYAEFKATAPPDQIDRAGDAIFEMTVHSSLQHGLLHADPHPGNYLFKDGKVFVIDFGFCKEWPMAFIDDWRRQGLAVLDNDLPAFTDATRKIGLWSSKDKLDHAALLACYRRTIMSMILVEGRQTISADFLRRSNEDLAAQQFSIRPLHISAELLAQSRLLWGMNALFADMGCAVDFRRVYLRNLQRP